MNPPPSKRVLAILTRLPEAGRAKTRLIPALGADGAAGLQREMTLHTLRQARLLTSRYGTDTVVWFEGGTAAAMRATFGSGPDYRPQPAGDLGVRMLGAIEGARSAGAERVVVIGCDCPGLDSAVLAAAFASLDEASAVLGPALDGGYYLIGVRSDVSAPALKAMFSGMPWSTSRVLEATEAALASVGVAPALLPMLSDVDQPQDLPEWEKAARSPETLSVVIAALNEEPCIAAAVASASASGAEVIVVDGGSTDGTREAAGAAGARVIVAPAGRAGQMNAGAAAARGDALLFLHGDTVLPPGFEAIALGILADPEVALGAFSFSTDVHSVTMRLFERGTNWRARRFGTPYGDQALFVRAATFRGIGGFPDLPVMEDYELVRRARTCGRVVVAGKAVVTSGRAWREHGPWRWMLANRLSVLAYQLGADPDSIARWRARGRRARTGA